MALEQTHPYHVAIDDQQITIRVERDLLDAVALTELLDHLHHASSARQQSAVPPVAIEEEPEQVALQKEVAAYQIMHPHLCTHHAGEWVAIYAGKLLDHDAEETALMARLNAQHPTKLILVRRVDMEPERELYVPSFQLVTP